MGLFIRLEISKLQSWLPSKLYHCLKGYVCFVVLHEFSLYDCLVSNAIHAKLEYKVCISLMWHLLIGAT